MIATYRLPIRSDLICQEIFLPEIIIYNLLTIRCSLKVHVIGKYFFRRDWNFYREFPCCVVGI